MQRISEIVGKSILSVESGEKVGKVTDVLVSADESRIIGLVIGGGLFSSEHVLPFNDVKAFGGDVVVARSHQGIVGPREWHDRGVATSRATSFKDKRVVTDRGRRLGTVKDVYVDEQTGTVEGYEVASSSLAGLVHRRSVMPADGTVTLGSDVVIVSEEVAQALESTRA